MVGVETVVLAPAAAVPDQGPGVAGILEDGPDGAAGPTARWLPAATVPARTASLAAWGRRLDPAGVQGPGQVVDGPAPLRVALEDPVRRDKISKKWAGVRDKVY